MRPDIRAMALLSRIVHVREALLSTPVDLGRDVGRGSGLLDPSVDGVAVVALVARPTRQASKR